MKFHAKKEGGVGKKGKESSRKTKQRIRLTPIDFMHRGKGKGLGRGENGRARIFDWGELSGKSIATVAGMTRELKKRKT